MDLTPTTYVQIEGDTVRYNVNDLAEAKIALKELKLKKKEALRLVDADVGEAEILQQLQRAALPLRFHPAAAASRRVFRVVLTFGHRFLLRRAIPRIYGGGKLELGLMARGRLGAGRNRRTRA